MSATVGHYTNKSGKQYPAITLKWKDDDKWPFSFGVGKAKLVLKHMVEIKAFVDQYDDSQEA